MNLKQAKKLRLLVKQLQEKGVITGDHCRYLPQKHAPQKILTGQLDSKGEPEVIYVERETRRLDPMCAKGVYRRFKRSGIAAVLGGAA